MQVLYEAGLHRTSRATTPARRRYSSAAWPARSTTCSPTPPRPAMVTAPTSGTSTPTSRWPTSTAATTTTPRFYQRQPVPRLRPRPGDRRPRRRRSASRTDGTATATPRAVRKKKSTSRIDVTVTGAQGVTPTGEVKILVDGVSVGTTTLSGGTARLVVGPFPSAGVATSSATSRIPGSSATIPHSPRPRLDRRVGFRAQRLGRGCGEAVGCRCRGKFRPHPPPAVVVKGGGHSYKGTSSSPDSLLIWTRAMNQVEMHDAFVGAVAGKVAPHRR